MRETAPLSTVGGGCSTGRQDYLYIYMYINVEAGANPPGITTGRHKKKRIK